MNELINIDNISVKYGRIEALRNLSMKVELGDFIGIVGPNGGGKSTLLKTILGLIKPYEGTITYTGTTLKKTNLRMGYVPQVSTINRSFPITVNDVVLTAKLPIKTNIFHHFSDKDKSEVLKILDSVGLKHLADRQIGDLSGGEFQKVLIARAIMTDPDILLLDEPTAMIDIKTQKQIYTIIKKLSGFMTIILVTHNVKDITKEAKKLIWLEKNVLAEGDPLEVYKYGYGRPMKKVGGR